MEGDQERELSAGQIRNVLGPSPRLRCTCARAENEAKRGRGIRRGKPPGRETMLMFRCSPTEGDEKKPHLILPCTAHTLVFDKGRGSSLKALAKERAHWVSPERDGAGLEEFKSGWVVSSVVVVAWWRGEGGLQGHISQHRSTRAERPRP